MQTHSIICGTTVIGMALLCAGCATNQPVHLQPVQQRFTPAPIAAPTVWMKTAKITAVNVNETDESRLLSLSMWRFNIVAPKPQHKITFIVEAQEIGKPPCILVSLPMEAGNGWPLNKELSVFVGQSPLYDGQKMDAKADYQIRYDSFRTTPLVQMGGSSTSSVAANPLSGIANAGSSGTPNQRPDGSFILSYGYRHGYPTNPEQTPEVAVVFRVEEQAY